MGVGCDTREKKPNQLQHEPRRGRLARPQCTSTHPCVDGPAPVARDPVEEWGSQRAKGGGGAAQRHKVAVWRGAARRRGWSRSSSGSLAARTLAEVVRDVGVVALAVVVACEKADVVEDELAEGRVAARQGV